MAPRPLRDGECIWNGVKGYCMQGRCALALSKDLELSAVMGVKHDPSWPLDA